MNTRRPPSRHAFTLLELSVVVVIAGIVAVSVIPSVRRVADARAAAGAFEIARGIEFARANALATGLPCGVRFDAGAETMRPLTVSPTGVGPTPGSLGEAEPLIDLSADFGADIVRVSLSAGPLASASLDTATLWFDHEGGPHLREISGVFVGPLWADGSVAIESGQTVRIVAISGLVEVEP